MRIALLLFLSCLPALAQTYAVRIPTNAPATGDLIIWSGSAWVPLARGTNGQILTATASSITWSNAPAGSGGGSGTVTSVGASTTVSGLGFSVTSPTTTPSISLTGVVAVASGGTGAIDASGARTALSLVPGTDVQAYDADLAAIAALANSGIIVRTGSGTVAARTITGDSEAVVSNGDGVSGNPTLSIGAAIARDSEVAATYAPLASPALTGNPTAPTASAGDNDASVATTAFVAARFDDAAYDATSWNNDTNAPTKNAVRDKFESLSAGSGDVVAAGNNTLTGTNTFFGPVWFKPNRKRIVLWDTDFVVGNGISSASMALPWLQGAAIASGTSAVADSLTNNPGIVRLTSASGANSGYYYHSSVSQLFAVPGLTFEGVTRIRGTNAGARVHSGFGDSVTTSAPTDAMRLWRSNNFLIPQIYANSSLTQGYEYPIESNQVVYAFIQVQTNMTDVTFAAYDSNTGTTIISTNLTATLPATASRLFGGGYVAWYTNAASVALEELDWSTAYIATPGER